MTDPTPDKEVPAGLRLPQSILDEIDAMAVELSNRPLAPQASRSHVLRLIIDEGLPRVRAKLAKTK